VIGAFSVLFLLLGIETLVAAYRLNNPHEFIMYFFASNLMILVSAVGLLYAGIRLYYMFKPACGAAEKDGGDKP
jgi:hypothetical protein